MSRDNVNTLEMNEKEDFKRSNSKMKTSQVKNLYGELREKSS